MSERRAPCLFDLKQALQWLRPQHQKRAEENARGKFNAIEEGYVVVKIRRRDGAILEKRVDYPRGAHQNPLSRDELHAKFRDCARPVLPREQSERALALLASLEDLPRLGDLVVALIPAGAP